jgi:hypothetical protein
MKKLLFLLIVCLPLRFFGQGDIFTDLKTPVAGKGTVTIQQDPKIQLWVNKHVELNRKYKGFQGFRIQVYFGSGSDAKKSALNVRGSFTTKFPDIDCYLIYEAPYFKVRAGDFRTREEAYRYFNDILKEFPGSFVVEDLIGYPRLD